MLYSSEGIRLMSTEKEELVIIGKIVAPQGIKGEVRVLSLSDFPERFTTKGMRLLLKDESALPQTVEILSGYAHKNNLFILQLAGINDRTQAEKLRNYLLAVPKSDRPPLAEDEFLVADLVGCTVIHQPSQIAIGQVSGVITAGNSILEITAERGIALVPFVKAIVPLVDINTKQIVIDPPLGLVDHLL